MNFNKVMLGGALTRDIEIKHAGNTTIGSFGLAINHRYTTKSGEKREEVTFVDCTAFGRTAEVMAEYLSKGSKVFIEGRLKLDQWEDRNGGGKRSKLRVTVDSFQFVGGKGDGDSKPQASRGGGGSPPKIDYGDIPFSPNPMGGA